LTSLGQPKTLTMSSREIAELTKKDHKNVIRDIRAMLDSLQKDGSVLSHEEIQDVRGYTAEYRLDRELTMTLVTGYDIPMRHRVVTRLAELESSKPAPNPMQALNDPAVMRGLQRGRIVSNIQARVAK